VYFAGYGLMRFMLELIRTDTTFRFLGLSRNGWVALAEPLVDGIRVVVPGPDGVGPQAPDGDPSGSASGSGKVAVNRADSEELQRLPGVGPVLAERIIDHREANGPFRTVEDLLDVPGIGEGRLAQIRDLVEIP
jgi:competence protein ComEA